MSILGFVGLSVLELDRGTRQTDRRTPPIVLYCPPHGGRVLINYCRLIKEAYKRLGSNNAPIFPREEFQREGAHYYSVKTRNRVKRNLSI